MTTNKNTQIELFGVSSQSNSTCRILEVRDRLNAKNELVARTMAPMGKKAAAELLELKGKDNAFALQREMRKDTDSLLSRSLTEMTKAKDTGLYTGGRYTVDNKGNITCKMVKLPNRDAEVLQAYAELCGITVERALAIKAEQEAKIASEKAEQDAALNVDGAVQPEKQ
jgi:hypothetical protein